MLFEKIPTTNEQFKETKKEHIELYEQFKKFAEHSTNSAGKAKISSNKPRSYANFLIRLFIFLKRQNIQHIHADFETLSHLEKLMEEPDFPAYNIQEVRFPSAAIKCFRAFVIDRAMTVEDLIDHDLNSQYITAKTLPTIKKEQLIHSATKRQPKESSRYGQTYKRSTIESFVAKERNNYMCEMSDTHFTFLTEHHQKPYVEAHHLIPMAAQDYFEYTIDFAHNIAVLCPICHRKIHYAQPHEKKEMIHHLFASRKAGYAQYGIDITEELLLSFYKILD